MDGWVGGWADGQTDRQIEINEPLINGSLRKSQFKSISGRLAVKSLFNSKFDFESTAPGKTDPTRLEGLKSAQVDLLGSTPRSSSISTSREVQQWRIKISAWGCREVRKVWIDKQWAIYTPWKIGMTSN